MSVDALAGESRRRVPELDGLRGVAILLVLVRHLVWGEMEPAPGSAAALFRSAISLSWSGVDLFFVLSGFLLAGVLLDNRDSPSYFRTFYIRRACRIVPLYYAMIALAFGWTFLVARGLLAPVPFRQLLPAWMYLTFTQNFAMANAGMTGSQWLGPTWSLAVEEQFYLCLPFLVRVVAPASFPYLAGALVLLAPAVRMALFDFHRGHGFAAYVLMPGRADALLLGALIAWGWRIPPWRASLARNRPLLYLALGVLVAGAAVLTPHDVAFGALPLVYVGYSWLAALYSVLLVLVLTAGSGLLGAVMRWGWLRGLGVVSYGVYLLHLPVARLVHGALLHDGPRLVDTRTALVTLVALAITVGSACLSWFVMERRIIERGHSFTYRSRGSEPSVSAVAARA